MAGMARAMGAIFMGHKNCLATIKPGVQKCVRALAPRNQKFGVRQRFFLHLLLFMEHKTGIDLNSFINTKKSFKKLYMFYFETFGIILNPSSVKKIKQHLAMSAIQNHKALWRKKRQFCDAKDVKRKPKTASHVKIAESKYRAKVIQRILKQNLPKAKIYDKPKPAVRGNSQTIASEECKKI